MPFSLQQCCKNCRHSRPHGLSNWEGYLVCKHPRICVCMPSEDFCCSEWVEILATPHRSLPPVLESTYSDLKRKGRRGWHHVTDEELAPTMKVVEGMRKKDRSEFTERSP